MADRSISVRLKAEVADFKREINSAGGTLSDLAKKAGGAEKVASTSLGRLAQSARLQREEWTTVGTALTTVGVAISAVGVAALKTGISYNTLQQTSRAALTSLTGSAEAANAQMDKLDAFARTSPFAKDVFIKAQQQMLGFGIEAGKVIPYLDSIQQAVAATGGSNQDIAELTRIFSQVSAASKITAVDLMQFGQRGVDAATLIGSQMGLTGVEIREQITAGTLDAGQALDALAAGMQERYNGAADNVKNTFAGAIDRVKAAWRDLSSELAEPLVGIEGGGLAVGGLNALADAMRAFQGLPDPIKQTAAALTGVTGVAALAGGSFLLLAPRVLDTYNAMKTLKDVSPGAAAGLGKVASAGAQAMVLVTVATAIKSMTDALARDQVASVEVERLAGALGDLADGAERVPDLGKLFENRNAMRWFIDDVETSEEALKKFADQAQQALGQGFADRLERFLGNGSLARFEEQVSQIDTALAAMVSGGSADQAADAFEALAEAAEAQGVPVERLKEMFPEYAAALDAATVAQEENAGATEDANTQLDRQAELLGELYELNKSLAELNMTRAEAEAAWAEQVVENRTLMEELNAVIDQTSASTIAATNAIDEGTGGLDLYTEAGRLANDALLATAEAGWRNVDSARAAGAGTDELREKTQIARDEFIRQATQLGLTREAAELLADQYGLIPENVTTDTTFNDDAALADIGNYTRVLGALDGMTVRTFVINRISTIETRAVSPANAVAGNLMGTYAQGAIVETWAGGGLRPMAPIAQVVPPNTWRVVGDRVKDDESYIPIDGSERSKAIWWETGRRLGTVQGFADGAVAERRRTYTATGGGNGNMAREIAAALDGATLQLGGVNRFSDSMSARIVTTRSRMAGVH